MNRNRYAVLLIAVALIIGGSCVHKSTIEPAGNTTTGTGGTGDTTNGGGGGTNSGDTALCFERDILPIFQSNCAKSGCHDAASAQDGYVFTSYQTITAKKFN